MPLNIKAHPLVYEEILNLSPTMNKQCGELIKNSKLLGFGHLNKNNYARSGNILVTNKSITNLMAHKFAQF